MSNLDHSEEGTVQALTWAERPRAAMAKWGEGDPRWIVEDRADGTNADNWHWCVASHTLALLLTNPSLHHPTHLDVLCHTFPPVLVSRSPTPCPTSLPWKTALHGALLSLTRHRPALQDREEGNKVVGQDSQGPPSEPCELNPVVRAPSLPSVDNSLANSIIINLTKARASLSNSLYLSPSILHARQLRACVECGQRRYRVTHTLRCR
jgi:hypothetical protein